MMKTSQHILGLAISVILISCYKQAEYDPLALDFSEVITELRTTPGILLANNEAQSTIIVFLPEDGQQGIEVTFQTDKGVFLDNGTTSATVKTKAMEVDGEVRIAATTKLRNGLSSGTINIKASLVGYEVETAISSIDNPPTGISLTVPSLVMTNDPASEMELTARLTAETGIVSLDHVVTMQVLDPSMTSRGTFRIVEDHSNAEGKCRFVFSIMPDTSYAGPLLIKAISSGSTGLHQDSTTIHILN